MISYGKIYRLGHRYVSDILVGEVVVQEKVDGSQFKFEVIEDELHAYSKREELGVPDTKNIDKNFRGAVEYLKSIAGDLDPRYMYYGEVIRSQRHNALRYDNVPSNQIVLFDIRGKNSASYLSQDFLEGEAKRLNVESIPELFVGSGQDVTKEFLDDLLKTKSFLGGATIEGVVIKNYEQRDAYGKPAMAKYVREDFKELNHGKPAKNKVTPLDKIIGRYSTEARWQKAYQRLSEEGKINGELSDIPLLLKEANQDLTAEEKDSIIEALWKTFGKKVITGANRGLPLWYKQKLNSDAFE